MLSNEYFLSKFRFDTAENEPAKTLQHLAKVANFANSGWNLSLVRRVAAPALGLLGLGGRRRPDRHRVQPRLAAAGAGTRGVHLWEKSDGARRLGQVEMGRIFQKKERMKKYR